MGASAIRSSVETLPIAVVMTPFAMFCGIIIKVTQKYRPINYLGWILAIVGFGLLTLLRPDSPTAKWAGFQFITAAGTGIIVRLYARSLTLTPRLTSSTVCLDAVPCPGAATSSSQRRGSCVLRFLPKFRAGQCRDYPQITLASFAHSIISGRPGELLWQESSSKTD